MKILVIDNFDSFTFNLVHYLEGLNAEVFVMRNDAIDFDFAETCDKIVLSPGPGLPNEAGNLMSFIAEFYEKKPILGVCLGMQALAIHFGDELYNLGEIKHGISEKINLLGNSILFNKLQATFNVGLYHSWAVKLNKTSPLKEVAMSENQVLMAIEHRDFPLFGVQFHPESILSEFGKEILENFLK